MPRQCLYLDIYRQIPLKNLLKRDSDLGVDPRIPTVNDERLRDCADIFLFPVAVLKRADYLFVMLLILGRIQ